MRDLINLNLEKINGWLCSNKIMLNTDKTKYIVYAYGRDVFLDSVEVGTCQLERVSQVKYLGVILDEKLRFGPQIDSIAVKISRSIGILFKLRHFYPIQVLKFLYYTFVHPYLLYGIEVWFAAPDYLVSKIYILQKRTIRCINSLDYNAHTGPIFCTMKILHLYKLYEFCVGIYMYKTIHIANFDHYLAGKYTYCLNRMTILPVIDLKL